MADEKRRYHADIQVTLLYHDAVYASTPEAAKEMLRRSVESIFDDLDPHIMDVMVHNMFMVPEPEDIVHT